MPRRRRSLLDDADVVYDTAWDYRPPPLDPALIKKSQADDLVYSPDSSPLTPVLQKSLLYSRCPKTPTRESRTFSTSL